MTFLLTIVIINTYTVCYKKNLLWKTLLRLRKQCGTIFNKNRVKDSSFILHCQTTLRKYSTFGIISITYSSHINFYLVFMNQNICSQPLGNAIVNHFPNNISVLISYFFFKVLTRRPRIVMPTP